MLNYIYVTLNYPLKQAYGNTYQDPIENAFHVIYTTLYMNFIIWKDNVISLTGQTCLTRMHLTNPNIYKSLVIYLTLVMLMS
jgi:hypothetical protein